MALQMIQKQNTGSALILVLMFMTVLLLAAGWLGLQTRTETQLAGAMKQFSQAINVADGALEIGVFYLKKIASPTGSKSWNPNIFQGEEIGILNNYSNFINQSEPTIISGTDDNLKYTCGIKLLDINPTPPPGWGLSERGYGNRMGTYTYELNSKGYLLLQGSNSTQLASAAMGAFLIKVQ